MARTSSIVSMVRLRIEGSSRIGHLLQPSKRSYTGSVVFAAHRSLSAARETASAHEGFTDKATTLARVRCRRCWASSTVQHPATHFPLPSNSIVRPLMARWDVTFSCLMSAAVRELGLSLPPSVTASFG